MSADEIYRDLVRHVLLNGIPRPDRTGTGTISVFGHMMRFDISKSVPLLTTKFVPWRIVIEELLWFMKGKTDVKLLQDKNVHIWDKNSSREFLDKRGLNHYEEGDIGPSYGWQWRHTGAIYGGCRANYTGHGHDQLAEVIHLLKTDPFSRRIVMTAWVPSYIEEMALPPCHFSCQFYVTMGNPFHLSCLMNQRSADIGLGLPFNIFSYAVLTYILAKMCNMVPHELIISIGDAHIYNNHITQLKEQLARAAFPSPTLTINNIENIESLTIKDFIVNNYEHCGVLKMDMSA